MIASSSNARMIDNDAPTVIGVQNVRRSPLKMRRPRPPCPMMAATVTSPTVETVAMRSPVMMNGIANGSSTFQTRLAGLMPMPSAESRTDCGTASNPATMFVTRINSVYAANGMTAVHRDRFPNTGARRANKATLGSV